MEELDTTWRILVVSFAVWRISQLLCADKAVSQISENGFEDADIRFWTCRTLDLLCWISVWMSSVTAIWTAFAMAGLFVCWLSFSVACDLFSSSRNPSTGRSKTLAVSGGDEDNRLRFLSEDAVQVNHG